MRLIFLSGLSITFFRISSSCRIWGISQIYSIGLLALNFSMHKLETQIWKYDPAQGPGYFLLHSRHPGTALGCPGSRLNTEPPSSFLFFCKSASPGGLCVYPVPPNYLLENSDFSRIRYLSENHHHYGLFL